MKVRLRPLFYALAFAGILVLAVFTVLCLNQLKSSGNPKEQVFMFFHYNRYLTVGNFLIYFILLTLANFIYWRKRYLDTFWWPCIIFIFFSMVDWWWLGEKLFQYKNDNDLWLGEFNAGPFIGMFISLFAITFSLVNYGLANKLLKKPAPDEDSETKNPKESNSTLI